MLEPDPLTYAPRRRIPQAGFARASQVVARVTLPSSAEPCCLLACTFEPGQKVRAPHARMQGLRLESTRQCCPCHAALAYSNELG
jgi:hypothetical protein